MVTDSPPSPAFQDDSEALIPEARDRQRRRRLLGASLVALAASLGLAVSAMASQSGFVGTIRDAFGFGGPPPQCRASQLKLADPKAPGVSNLTPVNGWGTTIITNTSGAACSIPAAQVSVFSNGKKLPLRQNQGQTFLLEGGALPTVHALQPGKSAQIDFEWQNWCSVPSFRKGGPWRRTVRLRLGSALTVSGQIARPGCARPGSPSTLVVAEPHAFIPEKS